MYWGVAPGRACGVSRGQASGKAMNYFVYILKSLKDNNHYIGVSCDVEKRLKQHNSGKTKSTKSRRPFNLIYKEKYDSFKDAREREKFLKSYSGATEKRRIINELDIGE